MAWKPGERRTARTLEDPYEDVPDHLVEPLWGWVDKALMEYPDSNFYDTDLLLALGLRLRIPLPGNVWKQVDVLRQHCTDEATFVLSLAEAILELLGNRGRQGEQLQDLLSAANSLYRVTDDYRGLEEVVAPGVKDQIQSVVASAKGSAGDHLSKAWNAAYGRQHDPVKAYSEAIKAVESALAPSISPLNLKQTLGTMVRDVDAKQSKWKFVIAVGPTAGVDTVLHMMRMLWEGQTSRHGGLNPTRAETLEEARAGVHMAATLVQYGVSGALSNK